MKRVALITGGCRGIGLGIAQQMAQAGFNLALTGVRSMNEVNKELDALRVVARKQGGAIAYFQSDLADTTQHAVLVTEVAKRLGAITALVLNAGIASPKRGDLLDLAEDEFDVVLNVNLRGNFFFAQKVVKHMLTAPNMPVFRSIQFITSVSAGMASPERPAYCISKAGAAMMASLFALRLAREGIGVYEVRPGIIATDMTSGVKAKYDKAIKEGLVPMERWGAPQDIGRAVTALAKGEFAFGTGSIINLDGGLGIHKL